jgi:riboflavin synthase
MFTGIVEEMGHLERREGGEDGLTFAIAAHEVLQGSKPGDSIAVNGVCLTVVTLGPGHFSVDVAPETLNRTNLTFLQPGDPLNLERAVTPQTRLGGHIVQGHVDGRIRLVERQPQGQAMNLRFAVPAELMRYVVIKGFVCVDGVSLTVTGEDPQGFSLMLVPITQQNTILAGKQPGYWANLEVDILGKYLEKWQRARS